MIGIGTVVEFELRGTQHGTEVWIRRISEMREIREEYVSGGSFFAMPQFLGFEPVFERVMLYRGHDHAEIDRLQRVHAPWSVH